jgi:hypothetical protein
MDLIKYRTSPPLCVPSPSTERGIKGVRFHIPKRVFYLVDGVNIRGIKGVRFHIPK